MFSMLTSYINSEIYKNIQSQHFYKSKDIIIKITMLRMCFHVSHKLYKSMTSCMLLTSCAIRDVLHASHKLCNTRRIACFSQVVQHETNGMLLTSCATRDVLHASHKLCNTRCLAYGEAQQGFSILNISM
jgi:hypothetical protein